MKTIVFIGTMRYGSSKEAMQKAEELGYFTVLLTDKKSQIYNQKEYPDVHYMIYCDLDDFEMMKEKISELILRDFEIEAIVSFIDPYCLTACQLADEFGIGKFSTKAVLKMQNKILSRQTLEASPYAPWFKVIDNNLSISNEEIIQKLPFIIKNPKSSGSRDVHLVHTFRDFLMNNNNDNMIIEEYLNGPQYLVETLVVNNEVNIIAIIAQEINFYNGHFIVTGYNLLIDIEPSFYSKIKTAVEDIIKLHGMENGACHLEMRYVNKKWKLIEINPRISGYAMNEFLRIGLGVNVVEETLKLAVGQEPNLSPKCKNYTFAEYIVLSNSGIFLGASGLIDASRSKGVKSVFVKPKKGTLLTPPVSLGNRYAYVIATGDNEINARENAKKAAAMIRFYLAFNRWI